MRAIVDFWDGQERLEPMAKDLQQWLHRAFESKPYMRQVKNFLHGTWLRHPLHPVLTDVPVGAWTAAAVFDLLDRPEKGRRPSAAGTAAIAVGLAGASAAAAAGFTDWQHLSGRARRVGFGHALLNVAASVLYGASLASRLAGAGVLGRRLGFTGYGIVFVSAYLGGDLVYEQQSGVRHVAETRPPSEFEPALLESELPEGQMRRLEVRGFPVLVARTGGGVFALADTCTHLACSLARGRLRDETIVCACHGSRFALADGRVLDGPATFPVTPLAVRVLDGRIEVRKGEPEEQRAHPRSAAPA